MRLYIVIEPKAYRLHDDNLKATTDNSNKSKPAVAMMTTAKDENEIDIDIDVDASDREEELEGKNDKKAIASKKVRLA